MHQVEDELEVALAERHVPGLTIPFAMVGACAGWLCGRALSGPLTGGVASGKVPEVAALWCGLVALIAGAYLTRVLRSKLTPRMDREPWPELPLLLVVVLAGTAGGGMVGALIRFATVPEGLGLGALCALPFWPVCSRVMRSAKRAARGRMGSLVAASDRRAVWLALWSSVSLATLIALPEHRGTYPTVSGPPLVAVAIDAAALAVLLVVTLLDGRAWWRLRRIGREAMDMQPCDPRKALELGQTVARTDLGLGAEVAAHVKHGSAYRHAGRVTALLIGSHRDAQCALSAALRRGVLASGAAVIVLAVHLTLMFPS